ncbi:Vigilin [Liparis tanakae]|uniref:Vigilin n=1 Tax=Liparis tanakae TaxID=230148 RepID=A0A4Z2HRJ0_9TELE|nr:Vigilin [Liparis tanakae]
MAVDVRHHRHFVSRRGQVLRELAEEYGGVAVSFPRTGANSQRVTLKGAKDCAEAAKRRIQEIVEDLESQVSVEVAVPQRYHRAVMGPKGCRIQLITREHEVQIKFPERDDGAAGITREAGQEAPAQENGEVSPEAEFVALKCDIITIAGRAEKCELAKAALLALVPITEDVEVSYELHRYIIGQKGSGIRKMMEEYEARVNIWVPQPEKQLDVIKVTGLVANMERAKQGLLDRVKEVQAEQADRDVIVILGYERNVEEASRAIGQLVAEWQEMVSREVRLDPRTHARIIGARGKAIRKLMEEFKVDIRFPQPGSDEPDKVAVTGLPEAVDNAADHLLNLEEEYMLSVTETETLAAYMKPPSRYGGGGGAGGDDGSGGPAKGFVVLDAPWNAAGNKAPDMSSAEDFPTFGMGVAPKQASAWGPKKF